MKKVKVFIERGDDGYSAYMEANAMDYLCVGDGKTVDEAVKDFYDAYNEVKDYYSKNGKSFEEAEFEFCYDSVSFLQLITNVFTLSGLSKITGINKKQLGHYVQGVSKPRPATAQKIKQGVLKYAKDLTSVNFIN